MPSGCQGAGTSEAVAFVSQGRSGTFYALPKNGGGASPASLGDRVLLACCPFSSFFVILKSHFLLLSCLSAEKEVCSVDTFKDLVSELPTVS